jgi:hypothetical protein
VRYEQAKTFDEVIKVVEKRKESMEEVLLPTMQSMVKTIHFSTKPEP